MRARAQLVGKINTAIDLLIVSRKRLDSDRVLLLHDLDDIQRDLENAERTIAIAAQDVADGDAAT